jgi:hypothetical protein
MRRRRRGSDLSGMVRRTTRRRRFRSDDICKSGGGLLLERGDGGRGGRRGRDGCGQGRCQGAGDPRGEGGAASSGRVEADAVRRNARRSVGRLTGGYEGRNKGGGERGCEKEALGGRSLMSRIWEITAIVKPMATSRGGSLMSSFVGEQTLTEMLD